MLPSLPQIRRLLLAALTLAVLTFLGLSSISAEEQNVEGYITISIPLDIHEQAQIDFGRVTRPTTGTNTFTLDWNNSQVTVTGGGDGFYVDGAERGRYRVRGPSGDTVEITATIGSFGVAGITVVETHLNGTSNTYTAVLNPSGMFFAHVGGVLTIGPDAPAGLHTANFYITANYP